MKANELMIGDLIMHHSGDICIVKKIEYCKGYACTVGSSQYLWDYNNTFEPIPLTKKILKANGLENERIIPHKVEFGDDNTRINIIDNGFFLHGEELHFFNTNIVHHETNIFDGGHLHINVRYVHQLQHLLRDIGLNDIADNLKLSTTN